MTVYDRGARAGFSVFVLSRALVEMIMDMLQRAIPRPQLKVIVAGTTGRHILR